MIRSFPLRIVLALPGKWRRWGYGTSRTARTMGSPVVVAPASFGPSAVEFVERACAELGLEGRVIADRARLKEVLLAADPGSLVLGSLSSDLGIEVAAIAEEYGLVHLEVGALSDRAVGRRSLRATGRASDTAAVVCRTLRGRGYRVVSESSPFASAIADALRALDPRTGLAVPIGEAGADFAAFWDAGNVSDVLVAIARPPLPEWLCEAIGHSGLRGVELVGVGSWGREAVDKVARDAGVHLRFVDVLPASLLVPDALTAPVRESLLAYLPTRRTVYGDLGWAAGLLLRSALERGSLSYEALAELRLDREEVGFGHGVAFDAMGHNLQARKALLAWERGEIIAADEEAE
jgi:hypothetical protein